MYFSDLLINVPVIVGSGVLLYFSLFYVPEYWTVVVDSVQEQFSGLEKIGRSYSENLALSVKKSFLT